MAVSICRELCRGCGRCVAVCPGDLLALEAGRARLYKERDCWMCLSCAKACPHGAIRGRLPFVLGDTGASIWPEATAEELRWICMHPDGECEEFVLRRREG
ncbi:MAG: ferredoxin family protein [Bacteroidota bacterium]